MLIFIPNVSPAAHAANDFNTLPLTTLHETLQQIDLIHSLIELYPAQLGLAQSPGEVWDVFRSGRVASMIGDSASVLRVFYRLGVRYITLTHNSNNLYADAAVMNSLKNQGNWSIWKC